MRRNFQGYVTENAESLLGIGSSAISQFPQGYSQNTPSTHNYSEQIRNGTLATARGWAFTQEDIIRKQIIDELMCFLEVDLEKICQKFSLHQEYFTNERMQLQQPEFHEIIAFDKNTLRMISPYRMTVRIIASVFDSYNKLSTAGYSRVA
jgi:oxygen-independent coproporphyrinogen-3 oxidase